MNVAMVIPHQLVAATVCLATIFTQLPAPCHSARNNFVRDQNEDLVDFPPINVQYFESRVPLGHLRPLGWQREPNGEIDQQQSMPTPRQFYDRFVSMRQPVAFRKVIDNAPATKKWEKNGYLIARYGSIVVDVVVKKELLRTGPKRMTLREFLNEFRYEDWYLTNYVPRHMMNELVLPSCLECGFRQWLMESELWLSSGGTSSRLHSHADHDLHCVVSGRKDFIFIEPKFKDVFEFRPRPPFDEAGYSEIDMDLINMFKYKRIADVPWKWTTLRAGDCVFVPAGYLHQVRSYGRSLSWTNHFSPSPDVDFEDCVKTKTSKTTVVPLGDAGFLWSYIDNRLLLTNDKLDAGTMRHHLLMVMRNSTHLSYEIFASFYSEVMAIAVGYPPVDDVWKVLSSGKNQLSRADVKSLDDDILTNTADVFNQAWKQHLSSVSDIRHSEL